MARKQRLLPGLMPAPEMVVKQVKIQTRMLTVIHPDNPGWSTGRTAHTDLDGAIVCAYPPATALDEHIAALKGWLVGLGATVRVMPRAASEAVVATAKGNLVATGVDTRTVREIATELVDVANSTDREALRAVVFGALDAEGV